MTFVHVPKSTSTALFVVLVVVLAGCSSDRDLPDAEPATGVHPSGISDETSAAFHGKEIARRGYDLDVCAHCHGERFDGGAAGVTCLKCHPDGPDACTTCHRDGPTTNAHLVHRIAGQTCAECHVVPTRWNDEGHVRRGGQADPLPAEVTFGARAAQTLQATDRPGPPTFADGTCTNVYCHGAVLHAGGGTTTAPRWNDPQPSGGCTQCHGEPPPSHVQSTCDACHKAAPHLDGKLDLDTDCNGCHRSTPVFTDLAGNTDPTTLTVGAHQAHITGPSRLRGPIACSECHREPASVTDPGHLDSLLPAEVFPAGAGLLARADSSVPTWDRGTAVCSGTYCHGGGIYLSSDPVAGVVRDPSWVAPNQVFCGSCHGVPPTTHAQNLTLQDCARCHPSVDASGNPILTGEGGATTSKHLDGVVDVL
jgi:predicted CxxxxCH...CXXCH cytochrome family protein